MQRIDKYSLADPDLEQGTSSLVCNGEPLPTRIRGTVLEAQFELDDGSLLILSTDDCPYEEGLHVYLLGPDGTVQDEIEAGAAYTPGILNIGRIGNDWLELTFFSKDSVHRLETTDRPRLRLPLPTGWRYPGKLRRHRLTMGPV